MIWSLNKQVYCPKHNDVDKYLKVECIPVLGETEYPPIFAMSSWISPGMLIPTLQLLSGADHLRPLPLLAKLQEMLAIMVNRLASVFQC